MTKEKIRKCIKEQRNNLTVEERMRQSGEVREKLFNLEVYKNCQMLFTFVSFQTEVDTHQVIDRALNTGKKVYVPRAESGVMEFYELSDPGSLIPGKFGVPEPPANSAGRFILSQFAGSGHIEAGYAVMLLPGLAFDPAGNRIGYGAGYYDRYFSSHPPGNFYKIALAYDFQIMESIPNDKYDVKADLIITPYQIIHVLQDTGR